MSSTGARFMVEAGVLEKVETTAGPCYMLVEGIDLGTALAATRAWIRTLGVKL